MKKFYFPFMIGSIALAICCLFSQDSSSLAYINKGSGTHKEQHRMSKNGLLAMQAGYQFIKLRNPGTGNIPPGIRSRELAFTSGLPVHSEGGGQSWNWRGPANIGGRMLCIAVDVDDENHLLAGSASGGMWESSDRGQIGRAHV